MAKEKKDFFAKSITSAIQAACRDFDVPQERLDIEVVETGAGGIFGLIRKKAHIRVNVKAGADLDLDESEIFSPEKPSGKKPPVREEGTPKKESRSKPKESRPKPKPKPKPKPQPEPEEKKVKGEPVVHEPVSEENRVIVKGELTSLLTLMGFPSTVDLTVDGVSVHCQIESDFEAELTGPEGKTLDSLQYLVRKMIARKIPDRLRLAIDVGDFRQRRLVELKERAKALGEQVKIDGKTQVISALNPSERRIVHMELQGDKEVASRSVGGGLFKKVLIFKPGKNKRPGPKRRPGNRQGRRGDPRRKKPEKK